MGISYYSVETNPGLYRNLSRRVSLLLSHSLTSRAAVVAILDQLRRRGFSCQLLLLREAGFLPVRTCVQVLHHGVLVAAAHAAGLTREPPVVPLQHGE
jgi:ribosomal protein S12 methylthiotransferase accessory factor YcaO